MGLQSLIEVCEEINIDFELCSEQENGNRVYTVFIKILEGHMDTLGVSLLQTFRALDKNPTKALFAAMSAAWDVIGHNKTKPTLKGRRKAAKISIKELRKLIEHEIEKRQDRLNSLTYLTHVIENDLHGKVQFDTENEFCFEDDAREPWNQLLGYRQWGDLTFLGGGSGGDWEMPVFWLIYYDGKKLRGYIPKDGNIWNYESKQALGNDDCKDLEFVKNIGWWKEEDWPGNDYFDGYDVEKIKQDVLNRIVVT